MTKHGYNGNPWKHGRVSGTLTFNELFSVNNFHGIKDGWYAEQMLRRRNVTLRSIGLVGIIKFNNLPLALNEEKEKFSNFWLEGVRCDIHIENYLGEENIFKPKRFHFPAIGIVGRYGTETEIFRMDRTNGFSGSIMLNDFAYDQFVKFVKNSWVAKEKNKFTSDHHSRDIAFDFDGYACYAARSFSIPNPDYKMNAIIIKSVHERTIITNFSS